jgi:hypothetical protein
MSYPGEEYHKQHNHHHHNNNGFSSQEGNYQPQMNQGFYNSGPPQQQYGEYNNGPPPQQYGEYNNAPSQQQFGGYNNGPPPQQFGGYNNGSPQQYNGFNNNNNQPPNFEAQAENMPFTQYQPYFHGGNSPGGNFGGLQPPYQGQTDQEHMQNLPHNQPIPQGFEAGQQIQVSNFSGKKKALLIGCNYFGSRNELRGCINDVHNMKAFLMEFYNFKLENMVVLTDDQQDPKFVPTRQNMLNAMRWLVSDAHPNDSFFFHYSGHGSQVEDVNDHKVDGLDDTIVPVDFQEAGMIMDDELNDTLVKPLPSGCRLTAIFDCCHSGTVLDLPYIYNHEGNLKQFNPSKVAITTFTSVGQSYVTGDLLGAAKQLEDGISQIFTHHSKSDKNKRERGSLADVVMFSGCKDEQTSADTQEQGVGSTGAMSYALIKSLKSEPYDLTYIQLLNSVRQILRGKYQQLPQLSSGRPMDMNHKFMM